MPKSQILSSPHVTSDVGPAPPYPSLVTHLAPLRPPPPPCLPTAADPGRGAAGLSRFGPVGSTGPSLGDNGLTRAAPLASATAVKAAQCGLFTVPWYYLSTQGSNPQFVKDWEAANGGKQPDLFNALGRDAMWGMVTAIKQANSTKGSDIRDALANLSPFTAVLGDYKWGNDGQPTYGGVTQQIQNGKPSAWTPTTTCPN